MKTTLLFTLSLLSFSYSAISQDSTKVHITFQTSNNQQVPLFKEILIGNIRTEGFDSHGYVSQYGTLTKNDFLANAPQTIAFEKNKPVVLVMTDDRSYKMKFYVDPRNNQTWRLTPAGQDFNKSKGLLITGTVGFFLSAFLFGAVAMMNNAQSTEYQMDKNFYDSSSKMLSSSPTLSNRLGGPPSRPSNLSIRYIIPAVGIGTSIFLFARGHKLYMNNRPSVERIE